jgi:hypothetical protein
MWSMYRRIMIMWYNYLCGWTRKFQQWWYKIKFYFEHIWRISILASQWWRFAVFLCIHSRRIKPTYAESSRRHQLENYWFSAALFDFTVHKHIQCCAKVRKYAWDFTICNFLLTSMFVKRVLIIRLASAGTNKMRHCEFNKNRLDPSRVNRERLLIATLG